MKYVYDDQLKFRMEGNKLIVSDHYDELELVSDETSCTIGDKDFHQHQFIFVRFNTAKHVFVVGERELPFDQVQLIIVEN